MRRRCTTRSARPVTGAEFRDGYEALDIHRREAQGDRHRRHVGAVQADLRESRRCRHFKMMQWDGKKFQIVTDWVPAPDPTFIRKLIEDSAAKYANENNITPRDCSDDWASADATTSGGMGRHPTPQLAKLHSREDRHERFCASAVDRTAAVPALRRSRSWP